MAVSAQFLELYDQGMAIVAGEAHGYGYDGKIEIDSWNWGVANLEITQEGRGTGQGSRIEPSIFSFSKAPDKSTVRMIQAMHQGEIFRKACFSMLEHLEGMEGASTQAGGEFNLQIELTDVVVTGYELSVRSGDADVELEESWEISYRTIDFLYDYGEMQTQLIRAPGSSSGATGSPVDELAKKAKDLDPKQRQDLIKRLGSL